MSDLDTSVLTPVFYADHIHHERNFALLRLQTPDTACCGVHTLAEIYANLTGMPGKRRASSEQANRFIGSVRQKLSLIQLDAREYTGALESAAELRIAGATIYDLLLTRCALKANATAIYTWNLRHYALCGEEIAAHLRTP